MVGMVTCVMMVLSPPSDLVTGHMSRFGYNHTKLSDHLHWHCSVGVQLFQTTDINYWAAGESKTLSEECVSFHCLLLGTKCNVTFKRLLNVWYYTLAHNTLSQNVCALLPPPCPELTWSTHAWNLVTGRVPGGAGTVSVTPAFKSDNSCIVCPTSSVLNIMGLWDKNEANICMRENKKLNYETMSQITIVLQMTLSVIMLWQVWYTQVISCSDLHTFPDQDQTPATATATGHHWY